KQKSGIIDQIAAPKPARLLAQAEEPFEAGALDPARGLADASAVKIEGRADSEHEGGLQSRQIFGHEFLLLGRAQSHPENIRLRCADSLSQFLLLLFVQR